MVYLLISGVGPMLGSGFWLIATERFDPHTAKKRFGQIGGAGTLGGLAGGLLAERVAAAEGVAAMLPLLAVLNLFAAWQIRQLGASIGEGGDRRALDSAPDLAPDSARSGFRVLAEAPYLRNLAALVLLGTIGAALMDYLFKAQAVATFGRGDGLLRFFAIYYASTSLLTFVLQTSTSRLALDKLGLAVSAGTPSLALFAGSVGGLLAPGFASTTAARGGESVLRGSLYRSGYELFYTPIPVAEKRAAKSLIDVGIDRFGDALGGGVVQLVLVLAPAAQYNIILFVTIACSAVAMLVASRLNRGYVHTLERSLLNRAIDLDLSDIEDLTTRTVMLRTMRDGPDGREAGGVAPCGAAHDSTRHRPGDSRDPGVALARSRSDRSRCCAPRRGCPPRSCRTSSRCWPGTRCRRTPSMRCARWRRSGSASCSTRSSIPGSRSPCVAGSRGCSRSACRNGPPTVCCSASTTSGSKSASSAAGRWRPSRRRMRGSVSTPSASTRLCSAKSGSDGPSGSVTSCWTVSTSPTGAHSWTRSS